MKRSRTRVKICGITRPLDAQNAVLAGADALGLVFYANSARAVNIEQSLEIVQKIPPFITLVALFVDAQHVEVERVIDALPINLLQFHGAEESDYCQQFSKPYIKALRMKEGLDVGQEMRRHPAACGFLLDAYRKGVAGGTGESFDWQRVPRDSEKPIILAGGLSPLNVAKAIDTARPYAVDVSGGVEESPGVKSAEAMQAFCEQVNASAQEKG